jgi:hypothetical protein
MITAPFTVVSSADQIVNRPPNAIAAAFETSHPRIEDAIFCRLQIPLTLNDPDYDIVRYQYVWKVNGRFFERGSRHPDDEPVSLGSAEVVVVGMGRVGTGAYKHAKEIGKKVVGLDSDMAKVKRHLDEGRRVVYADAEDPLLWHRLRLEKVKVIMLAVPDLEAKVVASEQLRRRGYSGLISATYVWAEEQKPILAAGADVTYNYFAEAGVGLANDTFEALAPEGKSRLNMPPQKPAPAKPPAP